MKRHVNLLDLGRISMNKLTYSDSPFFSNWSQTYFTNLTLDQHIANNNWLMNTLTMLKDDGILYVPVLDKNFNRLGEEVNTSYIDSLLTTGDN